MAKGGRCTMKYIILYHDNLSALSQDFILHICTIITTTENQERSDLLLN